MEAKFPFEVKTSSIFGKLTRPIAKVDFWSNLTNNWVEVIMLVDSGADFTLLPKFYAKTLGINLKKDCKAYSTFGIGGSQKVYLLKEMKVKLGQWELNIPLGFLDRDNIPPLLGREDCLDNFKVIFFNQNTSFSDFTPKK